MALTKWLPPTLRRDASIDDEHVTWLELYFDLVYVAALIQLGDRLADDVTVDGVWRFAGAFVVLWWTWTGTTAFVNRFAADDLLHRFLVFAQMFAVGNLALIAVGASSDRSFWLVIAYVAARLPLLIMYARILPAGGTAAHLARTYMSAFGVGALLWLASLALSPSLRPWVWAAALLIEFATPIAATRKGGAPPVHSGHFRERYALFTIIVLGESFVKTLTELAGRGISIESQVFGMTAFAIGVALWWTYFDDVAESSMVDSTRGIRIGWVYTHLPLTAAITAIGVGSKKFVAVDTFGDEIKGSYVWLLGGALAVALLSVAVLDALTTSPHFAVGWRARILPRLVAAGAALFVAAFLRSPALLVAGLLGAIAVGQIVVEVVVALRAERVVQRAVASQIMDLAGTCSHLVEELPRSISAERCTECARQGKPWVELRECLICGHVGCCDDSPGRHAREHFDDTGHPIIATAEPGSDWAYCFVDNVSVEGWALQVPDRAGE